MTENNVSALIDEITAELSGMGLIYANNNSRFDLFLNVSSAERDELVESLFPYPNQHISTLKELLRNYQLAVMYAKRGNSDEIISQVEFISRRALDILTDLEMKNNHIKLNIVKLCDTIHLSLKVSYMLSLYLDNNSPLDCYAMPSHLVEKPFYIVSPTVSMVRYKLWDSLVTLKKNYNRAVLTALLDIIDQLEKDGGRQR